MSPGCTVVDADKQLLGGGDGVFPAQHDILIFHGVELVFGELLFRHGMRLLL